MAARNSGNRRRLTFCNGSRRTDTKGQPARQLIRSAGARLFFLPPYCPDLNPIEMVFAKLKTLLRKADERSIEATWRSIGDLLAAFSAEECAAYLRHAGYASIQA